MSKISLEPVSQYQAMLAYEFAKHCVDSNRDEYARRNQTNISKILTDINEGKLAEYQVFNTLMLKGKNPSPPDIMIYGKNDKSFDADITCGLINVHVKSCSGTSPFGNSWIFQPNDELVTRPTETDYLALCVLGEESYMYLVKAADMEYTSPVKDNLDKGVIYEDFVTTYLTMKEKNLI